MTEGQRSVSMSCSDKIVMWNSIGFQGAVLSNILSNSNNQIQPLKFSSIVIEATDFNSEHNKLTLKRGLFLKNRIEFN